VPPGLPTQERDGDDAAVGAAREGDLGAWAYLIRRHQGLVFRTAWLSTRDAQLAEEATKVTFTRAHRSLRSLEPGALLRPWLMGITATAAHSQVRNVARSRAARAPVPDPSPRLPSAPAFRAVTAPALTPGEAAILHDAFEGLSGQDRLVLASRFLFGLTRAEAAALLAIPVDQVERRLTASLGQLRRRVSESLARAVDGPERSRIMADRHDDRLAALGDVQLGHVTMAVATSGLHWTPDVAAAVCDRLAREAAAYPEHVSTAAAG
jgi:RNA polymerase sigma-70 factor (ECF subfamily)